MQQLFYLFIKGHFSHFKLVFGVLPRYIRYTRVLQNNKMMLLINNLFYKAKQLRLILVRLYNTFFKVYKDVKLLPLENKAHVISFIKNIFLYKFIIHKKNLLFEARYAFLIKELALNGFNLYNDFSLKFLKLLQNNNYVSRRRLFFFSCKNSLFLFKTLILIQFFAIKLCLFWVFPLLGCWFFSSLIFYFNFRGLYLDIYDNTFILKLMVENLGVGGRVIVKSLVASWWKRWFLLWRFLLRKVILKRLYKLRFMRRIVKKKVKKKLNRRKFNKKFKSLLVTQLRSNKKILHTQKAYFVNRGKLAYYWRSLRRERFINVRIRKMVHLYRDMKVCSSFWASKRFIMRKSSFLSWELYMDSYVYNNKIFNFKRLLEKKKNKLRKQIYNLVLSKGKHLNKNKLNLGFLLLCKRYFCEVDYYFKINSISLIKKRLFFFYLLLHWFKQLFFYKFEAGKNIIFSKEGRYKFYVNYLRLVNSKFSFKKRSFASKLFYFRRIRRFFKKNLVLKLAGYRRMLHYSKFKLTAVNKSLMFYSLFKRSLSFSTFDVFFTRGYELIIRYFCRKLRNIKRILNLVTLNIYTWNNFVFIQLSLIKMKRKPFALVKMKRLSSILKLKVHLQKYKLYAKVYQILIKFLLSYRLTGLWLKLRGLVTFFSVSHIFVLNRNKLRRLLSSVRNSFYLRYYKNKAVFLNSLLLTMISIYYRSPFMLNDAFCNVIRKQWKHRVHIFDTFKLITAILWRVAFRKMSANMQVKTVYMQINGKINSGTRTKHFKLRVDYKPAFLTLQNSLSFSANTANPRTGVFGVQTWFCY
jgi:hypothetical protein